jgi:hypothetical protein
MTSTRTNVLYNALTSSDIKPSPHLVSQDIDHIGNLNPFGIPRILGESNLCLVRRENLGAEYREEANGKRQKEAQFHAQLHPISSLSNVWQPVTNQRRSPQTTDGRFYFLLERCHHYSSSSRRPLLERLVLIFAMRQINPSSCRVEQTVQVV